MKRRSISTLVVKVEDHIIPQVTQFKYFRYIIQDNEEIEVDLNHRVQVEFSKWRRPCSVLSDTKVSLKLKEKVY